MDVSEEWKIIILQFYRSIAPRIIKLQDIRIAEEWRNKNFTLYSRALNNNLNFKIKCNGFISDQKVIAMKAILLPQRQPVILVYNALNFAWTHTLGLRQGQPGPGPTVTREIAISLKLDENYLYAYVYVKGDALARFLIWDRAANFSPYTSQATIDMKNYPHLASSSIVNIPRVHQGVLSIPCHKTALLKKYIYYFLDVKENVVKKRVEKDFPSEEFYLVPDGSGCYFTYEDNELKFYDAQDSVVWKKQVTGRSPAVIGLNDEYVAVAWVFVENLRVNDLVEVYVLKTGVQALSVECKPYMKIASYVQFSGCRFAYSFPLSIYKPLEHGYEIFVYDLKIDKQILNLAKDFSCSSVGMFVLERDRIIIAHGEELHSANFWI